MTTAVIRGNEGKDFYLGNVAQCLVCWFCWSLDLGSTPDKFVSFPLEDVL